VTSSNLPVVQTPMTTFAREADAFVATKALEIYRQKKSKQTVRRHMSDIALFEQFLASTNQLPALDYQNEIEPWGLVTHGVLEVYRQWMLNQGYAMGSVNGRLYTARKYCELAFQSGFMGEEQFRLVQTIKGYSGDERRNIDEQRSETRMEKAKKAVPTPLTYEQAEALKAQDIPCDALIMCLFIDHGFRVGEVVRLRISDFNLAAGELKFYRHKVNKTQTHRMTPATLAAARTYLEKTKSTNWAFPGNEKLNKDDEVGEVLGVRYINRLVGRLGKALDIADLSPHDLRHYWATRATKLKTHVRDLQQAGGWNSPYMPLRYAADNAIANEGVMV